MIKCRISTEYANGEIDAMTVNLPALPQENNIICFRHGDKYLTQRVNKVFFYLDIDLANVTAEEDSELLEASCSQIWINTSDCEDEGGHPELLISSLGKISS